MTRRRVARGPPPRQLVAPRFLDVATRLPPVVAGVVAWGLYRGTETSTDTADDLCRWIGTSRRTLRRALAWLGGAVRWDAAGRAWRLDLERLASIRDRAGRGWLRIACTAAGPIRRRLACAAVLAAKAVRRAARWLGWGRAAVRARYRGPQVGRRCPVPDHHGKTGEVAKIDQGKEGISPDPQYPRADPARTTTVALDAILRDAHYRSWCPWQRLRRARTLAVGGVDPGLLRRAWALACLAGRRPAHLFAHWVDRWQVRAAVAERAARAAPVRRRATALEHALGEPAGYRDAGPSRASGTAETFLAKILGSPT